MCRVINILMSLLVVAVGAEATNVTSQTVATAGFVLQRSAMIWFAAAVIAVLYFMRRRHRVRKERAPGL